MSGNVGCVVSSAMGNTTTAVSSDASIDDLVNSETPTYYR